MPIFSKTGSTIKQAIVEECSLNTFSSAWILPIELTLSVSALYELIEWAVADIFFKAQGAAYLGTQGDYWDAQKDIFLAFLGAAIGSSFISVINRYFKII